MLQSAFHGNAKKQSGNVTDYNEIGEFSYGAFHLNTATFVYPK
jgi:hypothetical protein